MKCKQFGSTSRLLQREVKLDAFLSQATKVGRIIISVWREFSARARRWLSDVKGGSCGCMLQCKTVAPPLSSFLFPLFDVTPLIHRTVVEMLCRHVWVVSMCTWDPEQPISNPMLVEHRRRMPPALPLGGWSKPIFDMRHSFISSRYKFFLAWYETDVMDLSRGKYYDCNVREALRCMGSS